MSTGTIVWYLLLIAVGVIFMLLGVSMPIAILLFIVGLFLLIWGPKQMKKEDEGEASDWPWNKKDK
jgi:hypothetical protein